MADGDGSIDGGVAIVPDFHESEASFTPQQFFGTKNSDGQAFLSYLIKFMSFKNFNAQQQLAFFRIMMRGGAMEYFDSQPAEAVNTVEKCFDLFTKRYIAPEHRKWRITTRLFEESQGPEESVDDYCTRMRKQARAVMLDDEVLKCALVRGFRMHIKQRVIESNVSTAGIEAMLAQARAAEVTETLKSDSVLKLTEEMRAAHKSFETELKKLNKRIGGVSIRTVDSDDDESQQTRKSRPSSHSAFDAGDSNSCRKNTEPAQRSFKQSNSRTDCAHNSHDETIEARETREDRTAYSQTNCAETECRNAGYNNCQQAPRYQTLRSEQQYFNSNSNSTGNGGQGFSRGQDYAARDSRADFRGRGRRQRGNSNRRSWYHSDRYCLSTEGEPNGGSGYAPPPRSA